jgi:hypothetical protein
VEGEEEGWVRAAKLIDSAIAALASSFLFCMSGLIASAAVLCDSHTGPRGNKERPGREAPHGMVNQSWGFLPNCTLGTLIRFCMAWSLSACIRRIRGCFNVWSNRCLFVRIGGLFYASSSEENSRDLLPR